MKRLYIFIGALFAFGQVMAQDQTTASPSSSNSKIALKKGSFLFSLGAGYSGVYSNYQPGMSPIANYTASAEAGIAKIGPGILTIRESLMYATMPGTYGLMWGEDAGNFTSTGRWTYVIETLGLIYHFGFVNNPHLDPYIGVAANYDYCSNTTTTTWTLGGASSNFTQQDIFTGNIGVAPYLGFRYIANKHIGFFGELSYGYTLFTAGASLKI